MQCEAKVAAHGGKFCTSVSVSYAGLYVSFSLTRDFLQFSEEFYLEIDTKHFFKTQKRV